MDPKSQSTPQPDNPRFMERIATTTASRGECPYDMMPTAADKHESTLVIKIPSSMKSMRRSHVEGISHSNKNASLAHPSQDAPWLSCSDVLHGVTTGPRGINTMCRTPGVRATQTRRTYKKPWPTCTATWGTNTRTCHRSGAICGLEGASGDVGYREPNMWQIGLSRTRVTDFVSGVK